jgi:hypothetical protein
MTAQSAQEDESILSFSWFIWDMIVKSMTLKLNEQSMLHDNFKRASRFDEGYIRILKKLTRIFTQFVRKATDLKSRADANNYLGLFIRDLFAIFDRGHAIDMVQAYIVDMATETETQEDMTISYLKFDFLKIVIDYEHYIPMNMPLPYSINTVQNMTQQLWYSFVNSTPNYLQR